jgi:hypothetical protein
MELELVLGVLEYVSRLLLPRFPHDLSSYFQCLEDNLDGFSNTSTAPLGASLYYEHS